MLRDTRSALHLAICASAPNQVVSSESHFECCVDYHFASETNSQLSIQVALELVLDLNLIRIFDALMEDRSVRRAALR